MRTSSCEAMIEFGAVARCSSFSRAPRIEPRDHVDCSSKPVKRKPFAGRESTSESTCEPALEPAQHLAIPELRVLGLQHPVVLVGEIHQARRHALRLEHAVALEAVA